MLVNERRPLTAGHRVNLPPTQRFSQSIPGQRGQITQPDPQPTSPSALPVADATPVAQGESVSLDVIARAQLGDRRSIAKLYQTYQPVILKFAFFRVGNQVVAEDIAADTWVRALKRLPLWTWHGTDIGAWLITIARNLIADRYKSGLYRIEMTTGDIRDTADRVDDDHGPEELAVSSDISAVMRQAVDELNDEQRTCIILRFFDGLDVRQTGVAMGKNEGAIKALQYRAVRALRRNELVQALGFPPLGGIDA